MSRTTDEPSDVVALADTVSKLLYGVAGWMLVVLGLYGVAVVGLRAASGQVWNPLAALVVLAVSLLFVALGVFVNPRFRRRLDRRHGPSGFGRARAVDEPAVDRN